MRLDNYLVQINLFDSRTKAQQAINRGEIYLNNKRIQKSSFDVDINANVEVSWICENSFVSLGGYKLQKALTDFNYNVKNLIVCDVGASTGGFTDCLLKNGASKVYAVDLNDQLLHEKLKQDDRVVSVIKNARELCVPDFSDELDLIVADLSFISISNVIDVFSKLLLSGKKLIVLIKPQFETGERKRFKNGIIRDKKLQVQICKDVYNLALVHGLSPINFTTAPIVDNKNVEFLMMFEKDGNVLLGIENIKY